MFRKKWEGWTHPQYQNFINNHTIITLQYKWNSDVEDWAILFKRLFDYPCRVSCQKGVLHVMSSPAVLAILLSPPVGKIGLCRYDMHAPWAGAGLAVPLLAPPKPVGPSHCELRMPYLNRSMAYVFCDELPENQLLACKEKNWICEAGLLVRRNGLWYIRAQNVST